MTLYHFLTLFVRDHIVQVDMKVVRAIDDSLTEMQDRADRDAGLTCWPISSASSQEAQRGA